MSCTVQELHVTDVQAAYALARARIELRLAELRAALDAHERSAGWCEHEKMERVERRLAELVKEVGEP